MYWRVQVSAGKDLWLHCSGRPIAGMIEHCTHLSQLSTAYGPRTSAGKSTEIVPRYVPHMTVRGGGEHSVIDAGDVSDLINRERRFYLRAVDDSAKHAAATLMEDSLSLDVDTFRVFDLHTKTEEQSGSSLDLGTVALQRIVTQMKGLHYDVQEAAFVKEAAKLSGLRSYTDYLTGREIEEDEVDVRRKTFV